MTFIMADVAMAASAALPPWRRMLRPDWAARGLLAPTMPRWALIMERRELKSKDMVFIAVFLVGVGGGWRILSCGEIDLARRNAQVERRWGALRAPYDPNWRR